MSRKQIAHDLLYAEMQIAQRMAIDDEQRAKIDAWLVTSRADLDSSIDAGEDPITAAERLRKTRTLFPTTKEKQRLGDIFGEAAIGALQKKLAALNDREAPVTSKPGGAVSVETPKPPKEPVRDGTVITVDARTGISRAVEADDARYEMKSPDQPGTTQSAVLSDPPAPVELCTRLSAAKPAVATKPATTPAKDAAQDARQRYNDRVSNAWKTQPAKPYRHTPPDLRKGLRQLQESVS
jgi:hypothetical protein